MALTAGFALAVLLCPAVSAANDHKLRTIEVQQDGRNHQALGTRFQSQGTRHRTEPDAGEGCAVSYGETSACCGQGGAGDVTSAFGWAAANGELRERRVCPSDKPVCVNYLLHQKYGSCQDSSDCTADHGAGSLGDTECPAEKGECRVYTVEESERRHCVAPGSAEETSAEISDATQQGCSLDSVVAHFPAQAKGRDGQTLEHCFGDLASGTSCSPACEAGFSSFGTIKCDDGKTTSESSCKRVCTITIPAFGSVGNCPNGLELAEGDECQPDCDPDYHPTGSTVCFGENGGLSQATCVSNTLVSAALDSGMDGTGQHPLDLVRVSTMQDTSAGDAAASKVFAPEGSVHRAAWGQFHSLGTFRSDCVYVRGPNRDSERTAAQVALTLQVSRPVTVYVCLLDGDQQRLKGFSKWPDSVVGSSETGWTQTTSVTAPKIGLPEICPECMHGSGLVFEKEFQTNEIRLPGNEDSGGTNYLTFVCPQDGSHCSPESVQAMLPVVDGEKATGCDSTLVVGSSCTPECTAGYTASGSVTCTAAGLRSDAVCTSNVGSLLEEQKTKKLMRSAVDEAKVKRN